MRGRIGVVGLGLIAAVVLGSVAALVEVDLYAGLPVPAEDRARLEQLYRYLLRPPLAQDRLRLTGATRGEATQAEPLGSAPRSPDQVTIGLERSGSSPIPVGVRHPSDRSGLVLNLAGLPRI
ncbi:MAG: hypothetical protein HY724_01345 [Candidatus Rokubacteria bacterium]|nr:hypothetical protein [Candidatus Rokubacteria bacterium]